MIVNSDNITLVFLKEHELESVNFFREYELEAVDFIITSEKEGLKDKNLRKCRYCKKTTPQVTFENIAHTIPEFLGNKFSISDFECDRCNKLFGEYEKQLSNFIGVSIPVNRTKGKKKIPEAHSYDKKIIAKKSKLFGTKEAIEIASVNEEIGNLKYDEITDSLTFQFETQPYIPIDVYKAFLKMALGLLPESDVDSYQLSFDLLQKRELSAKIKDEMISVFVHHLNEPYIYNGLLLFKAKGNQESLVPPYTMVLLYGQSMYQIYLPLQEQYLLKVSTKTISCPLLPPIHPGEGRENIEYIQVSERLDSIISKSSIHKMTIKHLDPTEKRVGLDADGKIIDSSKFDPNKIVKLLIIADPNFKIIPNEK